MFALCLSWPAIAGEAGAVEAQLLEAERDLDRDLFGERSASRIEALARGPQAPLGRIAAVLARYHRLLGDDRGAVAMLVAQVCAPADAKTWQDTTKTGRAAITPSVLALVPDSSRWSFAADRIESAIALADLLAAAGQIEPAGLAIAAALEHGAGVGLALALESAGGLKAMQHDLDGAIEALNAAVRALTVTNSDGTTRPEDARQSYIHERLATRLAELHRRREEERYGPGFVRYRDAEQLRRGQSDHVRALFAYEAIARDFPGTIWAEAAVCYRVKCLLALAVPSAAVRVRERLAAVSAQRDAQAQTRQVAVRLEVPPASLAKVEATLAELTAQAEALRTLPLGPAARQRAEAAVAEFRRASQLGLYREECVADLASASLTSELDPTRAQALGEEAWTLLGQVQGADASVASLEVPAAAREVAAPPAQAELENIFGTGRANPVPIGALLNRRSAPWWLEILRQRTATDLAILALARGDQAGATTWLARLPGGSAGGADDEWDNRGRLGWAVAHGHVFALPAELAQFSGRARLAVLIADGCYVTGSYDRALELIDRLLAGEFGRLSRAASDYPLYLRAWCHYRNAYASGSEELGPASGFIGELEAVLATREHTLTESRAAWMIGQAAKDCADPALRALGVRRHEELIASGSDDTFAYKARLALGLACLRAGERVRGLALLRGFPPGAKDWREAADQLIALAADGQDAPKDQKP